MKKLFSSALAAVLLIACMICASADAALVVDSASLFTQEQAVELAVRAQGMSEKYQTSVVIVTTNDAGGKESSAYADDFFDYNGYGYGSTYDGVLLLIDMDNRKVFVSTSGYTINNFDYDRTEALLDRVVPYVSDGSYYGAACAFLNVCENYLENEDKNPSYVFNPATGTIVKNRMLTFFETVICLAAAVILMLIIVAAVKKSYKGNTKADNYALHEQGKLDLTQNSDTLVNKVVTTRRIPRNPPSSGGSSGGGGGRVSSSGRSHGGGGRGF